MAHFVVQEWDGALIEEGADAFKEGVMSKNWFDISVRLRRHIMISPSVFGYKWSAQCGNWVVIIVRNKDVYKCF